MSTWVKKASQIYEPLKQRQSAVLVNKKIYCLGGYGAGSSWGNAVEIYDTETDTWSKGADIPEEKRYGKAVAANNKIYFIGGITGNDPTTTLEIYDVETETWSYGANMPESNIWNAYPGCALWENQIHCFCGETKSNDHYVYNIDTDSWSQLEDCPISGFLICCINVNGKIHCICGSGSLSKQDFHYIYDPLSKIWERLADFPYGDMFTTNEMFLRGDIVGNKIYFIQYFRPEADINYMFIYNTLSRHWELETIPVGITFGDLKAVNGTLYGMGGVMYNGSEYTEYGITMQYTPDSSKILTIFERHTDESGTQLADDQYTNVDQDGRYTSNAPTITGYTCIGYKIDGGTLLSGSTAVIDPVAQDHTITFIYRKDDDSGNNGDDCCKCCCTHIDIHDFTLHIDHVHIHGCRSCQEIDSR